MNDEEVRQNTFYFYTIFEKTNIPTSQSVYVKTSISIELSTLSANKHGTSLDSSQHFFDKFLFEIKKINTKNIKITKQLIFQYGLFITYI